MIFFFVLIFSTLKAINVLSPYFVYYCQVAIVER